MSCNLLISIVMPVYNVEKHISRALKSLQNQTYENFEVVIVNDASQDNSIEIAEGYVEEDSRFKIISHEKNLGTYHARKTGVKAATGDFVLFLDPDDALEKETLKKIFLKFNKNIDLVLFGVKKIPKEKFYQKKLSVPRVEGTLEKNTIDKILKHKGFSYGTAGKAYKKKVLLQAFEEINLPVNQRLVFGEDVLLFAVCFTNSSSVAFVNERLYLYYFEDSSITRASDKNILRRNLTQLEYILEKLACMSEQNPYPDYSIFMKSLKYDSLNLAVRLEEDFQSNLKNYISLMKLKPNLRVLAKFIMFLCTFGGYVYSA